MADEPKEVKPGWKTTEFWLTVAAAAVGFLYASGAIGDGTQADKVLGIVSGALSALGYSVSRGLAKK